MMEKSKEKYFAKASGGTGFSKLKLVFTKHVAVRPTKAPG